MARDLKRASLYSPLLTGFEDALKFWVLNGGAVEGDLNPFVTFKFKKVIKICYQYSL